MFQATCIQKFKKNNRIYGYRLQDSQGNTKDVYADQLKTAIKNQQITIINLTLTSDNRLIDTTPTQQPQISEEQKIKNIVLKSKVLGFPVKEIPTACNHKCYLISKSETQHIIYIPDDVTYLNIDLYTLIFTDNIRDLQGAIKVIGGHSLKDTSCMFYGCHAQSIDLSSFNTSNVTDMSNMFWGCKAQSIDFSHFNTSKVTTMESMFSKCQVKYLDLSPFDTSKVTNMSDMFEACEAKLLDLSSFNTSEVTDMRGIFTFTYCEAKIKATDQKILERIQRK